MEEGMNTRLRDMVRQYEKHERVLSSPFLDPATQREAEAIAKNCPYALLGGYREAERRALVLLPYGEEATGEVEESIFSAVRVKTPYASPTHRDYLGSVLGLGIKRECVGDILVSDEGALIVLTKAMAPYVKDELVRVGRAAAKCELVPLSLLVPPEKNVRRVSATVASLRLDSAAAAAFSLSRSRMGELIDAGEVFLNFRQTLRRDAEVHEGDVLSVRHLGRAELSEIGGKSRKDRLFLTFLRYE